MLDLNETRERHHRTWQSELSMAYVLAVASAAGVACEFTRVDIFGVDATLTTEVPDAEDTLPCLWVQMKSWTAPEEHDGCYSYPLEVRNYDYLVKNSRVHRILVLVVMPPSREDWFQGTDEQGAIRHCAYWKSLQGEPPTDNTSTKTVYVPKRNRFSVEALRKMMLRIANGGSP